MKYIKKFFTKKEKASTSLTGEDIESIEDIFSTYPESVNLPFIKLDRNDIEQPYIPNVTGQNNQISDYIISLKIRIFTSDGIPFESFLPKIELRLKKFGFKVKTNYKGYDKYTPVITLNGEEKKLDVYDIIISK